MKKLTVNVDLFKEIGMTILTERPSRSFTKMSLEFQKDRPFLPKGVTLEEARDAMRKCKMVS